MARAGTVRAVRRPWIAYLAVFVAAAMAASLVVIVVSDDEDLLRGYTSRASSGLVGVIDNAEVCHLEQHRRFTASVPELERTMQRLAPRSVGARLSEALAEEEFDLDLQASDSGRHYTQRVTGDHIDQALTRNASGFTDSDGVRPADRCEVPDR